LHVVSGDGHSELSHEELASCRYIERQAVRRAVAAAANGGRQYAPFGRSAGDGG
jgi:hypothetical protein